MTSNLSFLGAAGTVTGSRFLLEVKDHRVQYQRLHRLIALAYQNL